MDGDRRRTSRRGAGGHGSWRCRGSVASDPHPRARWGQGLSRYTGDLTNGLLEADYIVVEMANRILGADWMPEYVARANGGGIERVLV